MDKVKRDGLVMKRKRKRETAKKVVELLEEKVRRQIQCSEQLQQTMRGIYYRLDTIHKIIERESQKNIFEPSQSSEGELSEPWHNYEKKIVIGRPPQEVWLPAGTNIERSNLMWQQTNVFRAMSDIREEENPAYIGKAEEAVSQSKDAPHKCSGVPGQTCICLPICPDLTPVSTPESTVNAPNVNKVPMANIPPANEAAPSPPPSAKPQTSGKLPFGSDVSSADISFLDIRASKTESPSTEVHSVVAPQSQETPVSLPKESTQLMPQTSSQLISAVNAETKQEGEQLTCYCAKIGTPKRTCPVKRRRIQSEQKPDSSGEPLSFTESELDNVFEEGEITEETSIGENERMFMSEFPELNTEFDHGFIFPQPNTSQQDYRSVPEDRFSFPQMFTEEEHATAFEEEEEDDQSIDLQNVPRYEGPTDASNISTVDTTTTPPISSDAPPNTHTHPTTSTTQQSSTSTAIAQEQQSPIRSETCSGTPGQTCWCRPECTLHHRAATSASPSGVEPAKSPAETQPSGTLPGVEPPKAPTGKQPFESDICSGDVSFASLRPPTAAASTHVSLAEPATAPSLSSAAPPATASTPSTAPVEDRSLPPQAPSSAHSIPLVGDPTSPPSPNESEICVGIPGQTCWCLPECPRHRQAATPSVSPPGLEPAKSPAETQPSGTLPGVEPPKAPTGKQPFESDICSGDVSFASLQPPTAAASTPVSLAEPATAPSLFSAAPPATASTPSTAPVADRSLPPQAPSSAHFIPLVRDPTSPPSPDESEICVGIPGQTCWCLPECPRHRQAATPSVSPPGPEPAKIPAEAQPSGTLPGVEPPKAPTGKQPFESDICSGDVSFASLQPPTAAASTPVSLAEPATAPSLFSAAPPATASTPSTAPVADRSLPPQAPSSAHSIPLVGDPTSPPSPDESEICVGIPGQTCWCLPECPRHRQAATPSVSPPGPEPAKIPAEAQPSGTLPGVEPPKAPTGKQPFESDICSGDVSFASLQPPTAAASTPVSLAEPATAPSLFSAAPPATASTPSTVPTADWSLPPQAPSGVHSIPLAGDPTSPPSPNESDICVGIPGQTCWCLPECPRHRQAATPSVAPPGLEPAKSPVETQPSGTLPGVKPPKAPTGKQPFESDVCSGGVSFASLQSPTDAASTPVSLAEPATAPSLSSAAPPATASTPSTAPVADRSLPPQAPSRVHSIPLAGDPTSPPSPNESEICVGIPGQTCWCLPECPRHRQAATPSVSPPRPEPTKPPAETQPSGILLGVEPSKGPTGKQPFESDVCSGDVSFASLQSPTGAASLPVSSAAPATALSVSSAAPGATASNVSAPVSAVIAPSIPSPVTSSMPTGTVTYPLPAVSSMPYASSVMPHAASEVIAAVEEEHSKQQRSQTACLCGGRRRKVCPVKRRRMMGAHAPYIGYAGSGEQELMQTMTTTPTPVTGADSERVNKGMSERCGGKPPITCVCAPVCSRLLTPSPPFDSEVNADDSASATPRPVLAAPSSGDVAPKAAKSLVDGKQPFESDVCSADVSFVVAFSAETTGLNDNLAVTTGFHPQNSGVDTAASMPQAASEIIAVVEEEPGIQRPQTSCPCGGTGTRRKICPVINKDMLAVQMSRGEPEVPTMLDTPGNNTTNLTVRSLEADPGHAAVPSVSSNVPPTPVASIPNTFVPLVESQQSAVVSSVSHSKDITCPCRGTGMRRRVCPVKARRAMALQKRTSGFWEPELFSEKELEDAFNEENIEDVDLQPNERMFMTEFPELNKEFDHNLTFPEPPTPSQDYSGYPDSMFCHPETFTDEEMENAFDESDEDAVREFQQTDSNLVAELPTLHETPLRVPSAPMANISSAGLPGNIKVPQTPTLVSSISATPAPQAYTMQEGLDSAQRPQTTCSCGGSKVLRRMCPMKVRRIMGMQHVTTTNGDVITASLPSSPEQQQNEYRQH